MEEEQKICTPYHTVNGIVPEANDLIYNGHICDCQRMSFYIENTCGCPAATAIYELKSKPNE